jgi:hypothetical protein
VGDSLRYLSKASSELKTTQPGGSPRGKRRNSKIRKESVEKVTFKTQEPLDVTEF